VLGLRGATGLTKRGGLGEIWYGVHQIHAEKCIFWIQRSPPSSFWCGMIETGVGKRGFSVFSNPACPGLFWTTAGWHCCCCYSSCRGEHAVCLYWKNICFWGGGIQMEWLLLRFTRLTCSVLGRWPCLLPADSFLCVSGFPVSFLKRHTRSNRKA
jgi:hypothetical protein